MYESLTSRDLQAALANHPKPPIGFITRTPKNDVVPVNSNGNIPRDAEFERDVVDETQERKGQEVPHELTPTLDTAQRLPLQLCLQSRESMKCDTPWHRTTLHKELNKDRALHLRIEVISGGFIISTDKYLTLPSLEPGETTRLGITTQQPRELRKKVIHR
jgi:hypothetical protein